MPSSVSSLQDGFRERSCSNSSKAESIASLPCQPTTPASQGNYTALPQRRLPQTRVPPTSQPGAMHDLGCVYGSQHRHRQADAYSSGSATSNLSNANVESNHTLHPSPDARGSGDISSGTSPSFVKGKTYNNIARPYRAPMFFEKTQMSTPLHHNMQLANKERLLNFNSNTPVSQTPNHTSVIRPIPRYRGSTNQLSVEANHATVPASVQPTLAQQVANFTEHKPRSARPFVSRRAHTVDLAMINKWDIATKNSRPRASLSTVREPVQQKQPWDNPTYDHQMLRLDNAMKQLREEIADVDMMLERKSPVKSPSHLDVNSNTKRSSSVASKGRDRSAGSINIALTDDGNVQHATKMDISSQPMSHDKGVGGSNVFQFSRPQQRLAVTEPLQRASSFDTADRQNRFTHNLRTSAEPNGRLGPKESIPLYRVEPHQRLAVTERLQLASSFGTADRKDRTAEPNGKLGQHENTPPAYRIEPRQRLAVNGPLQRASSFDTADRQDRSLRSLRTAEKYGILGQKENTPPYRDEPHQSLKVPVNGPLQRASSFDTADRQDRLNRNARTAQPNGRLGQKEHVSLYNSGPHQSLAVPVTGPLKRASSFDTAERQDRLNCNVRTTEQNGRLGQKENIQPYRSAPCQRHLEFAVGQPERASSFDTTRKEGILHSTKHKDHEESVPSCWGQTGHRLAEPLVETAEKKDRFSQNSDPYNQNARTKLSAEHKKVPATSSQPVQSDVTPCQTLSSNVHTSTHGHNTSLPDTLSTTTNCSSPSSYFMPINPVGDTISSHSFITDHPPAVVKATPLKQSCTVDVSSLTNLFSPPEPDSTTVQLVSPVAMPTTPLATDSPVKSAFHRTDPNRQAKLVKQRSLPSSFLEGETETPKHELHHAQSKDLEAHEWEESFNRPDSPLATPLLLPKESIIIRNRCHRTDSSSSSSDSLSSPQRSPRVSPRILRRKKVEKAHTLGAVDGRGYLAVPGQR